MHIGTGGITQATLDTLAADIAGLGITPVATVQTGDLTNTGVASEDTTALAWLGALPNTWYVTAGNHDITNDRSAAQFATTYGMAGENWVADLTFCVLIGISLDDPGTISQDTLDWLDTQLTTNAAKPCLIFCHFPLYGTVGGDPALYNTSFQTNFYVTNSAAVETILGNHANARAWIAGHTHSPWDAPDFVMEKRLGSHNVAIINSSSPWYTYFVMTGKPKHDLYIEVQANYIDVWVRQITANEWLTVYRITP